MRWRDGGVPAAALAMTLVAAACSGDGQAGVGVEEVSTEVVFGAASGDEVTGPANFNPGVLSPGEARGNLDLPDQLLSPIGSPGSTGPSLQPISAPCPEALLDEFPDRSAGVNVPHDPPELPREGAYRWKKAGRLNQTVGGVTTESDVTGFERRLIRNVKTVEEDEGTTVVNDAGNAVDGRGTDVTVTEAGVTFTYEMVQRDLSSGSVVVTEYQVITNADTVYQDTPVGVGPPEVREGQPERGLVMKSIVALDNAGNRRFTFQPLTGLLLLPLRVVQGEEFESVAMDTAGQQYRIEAKVVGRKRIDACGDIVDGWLVESTFTATGPRIEFTRDYDYIVAPQYGGVLISEKISQAGDDTQSLEFTLGQQDPDPLSEDDTP